MKKWENIANPHSVILSFHWYLMLITHALKVFESLNVFSNVYIDIQSVGCQDWEEMTFDILTAQLTDIVRFDKQLFRMWELGSGDIWLIDWSSWGVCIGQYEFHVICFIYNPCSIAWLISHLKTRRLKITFYYINDHIWARAHTDATSREDMRKEKIKLDVTLQTKR